MAEGWIILRTKWVSYKVAIEPSRIVRCLSGGEAQSTGNGTIVSHESVVVDIENCFRNGSNSSSSTDPLHTHTHTRERTPNNAHFHLGSILGGFSSKRHRLKFRFSCVYVEPTAVGPNHAHDSIVSHATRKLHENERRRKHTEQSFEARVPTHWRLYGRNAFMPTGHTQRNTQCQLVPKNENENHRRQT